MLKKTTLSHTKYVTKTGLSALSAAAGNWPVPAAWMHFDVRRFRQLFLQHPNLRICLSGHSHQHETLQYLGI